MMSKKLIALLLLLCILTVLQPPHYAEAVSKPTRILILYQERNFFADKRDTVSSIEELMGNFQVDITEMRIETLGNQDLQSYDVIFVIALDQTIEEPMLIDQLTQYKGRIIWLGSSIEQLIQSKALPLQYEGENYQFINVTYATNYQTFNKEFALGEKRKFYQIKSLSDTNKIYSWLSDGIHRYPFIIESGNLSYISRVDMNEPLFYIFAKYLMGLFPQNDLPSDMLMVSIQDVHGFSDQVKLRELADRLYQLNIPFSVQLIPYFKMKDSRKMYNYSEIPQFVETLKYMASKGGSLIVESYPVELSGSSIIPLSYDSVMADSPSPIKDYFESVFHNLVHDGLVPVGFSSPHGQMSDEELLYLKSHLKNYIGLRYVSNEQYVIYPYVLDETKLFHRFYPLNLGYMDYNNPNIWSDFDQLMNKISIVDTPFYGVYFSPDLPVDYIDKLYDKALQHQLHFFDLRSEPLWVNFDSVEFDNSKEKVFIEKIPIKSQSAFEKLSSVFANGVLAILSFGLILFIGIYWRSLRKTKALSHRR